MAKRAFILTRPFLLVIVAILCTILVLSLWFAWHIQAVQTEKMNNVLEQEAGRIETAIIDVFDHTAFIIELINTQIKKNPRDLHYISDILSKFRTNFGYNNLMPWTIFLWADSNHNTQVNSHGIIKSIINLSHRDYVYFLVKEPNKFHTGVPAQGVNSRKWMIPTGIGAVNDKGDYIGATIIGLEVSKLIAKLKGAILSNHINFILYDLKLNKILESSPNYDISATQTHFSTALKANTQSGEANYSFKESKTLYTGENYLIKKISKYPYFLQIAYNPALVKYSFWEAITSRLIELLVLAFVSLLLFYIASRYTHTWHKAEQLQTLMHLSETSDKAKEAFVQKIHREIRSSFNTIYSYSEILQKYLKGEINVAISDKHQIEMLNKIMEAANDLNMLTTNTLSLSFLDIKEIVRECVTIQAKTASNKNIVIESSIQDNMPPFYADDLRFKQIIIGLLSRSIEYSPKGSYININIELKNQNSKNQLYIAIQDTGFGLAEADLQRIEEKFSNKLLSRRIDGIDLDLSSIEQLVKVHKGELHIENKWGKGTTIIITLPYLTKTEWEVSLPTNSKDIVKH